MSLGSGVALAAAISGTQGNDTLRGTINIDQIYGLNGSDIISGGQSADELYGGAGNDDLYGGPGGDYLNGGKGIDIMFGEGGNDYIDAADNRPDDLVNCGAGVNDKAVYDTGDNVKPNCEDQNLVP